MRNVAIVAAVWIAAALTAVGNAAAADRVALVIGNSAYESVPKLRNPRNDAEDMAAALTRVGFDVTKALDLDYSGMRLVLKDFAAEAAGAETAVVYFAGHGIEIAKQNFLIPTDARLETDRDVAFEAIPLEQLVASVADAKGLKLVLLDACRNNPFIADMNVTSPSRSIGRGLGRVDPPSGILIGFAAKEGTTADDGAGRNSPYAGALLAQIDQPGVDVGRLLRRVRDGVIDATGGRQEPFTYGSLPGDDVYLHMPVETVEATIESDASRAFDVARDMSSPEAWKAFLATYGDAETGIEAFYAELARQHLRDLEAKGEKVQVAALPPAETSVVVPATPTVQTQSAGEVASPETVETSTPAVAPEPAQVVELDREGRMALQLALAQIGHDPGPADGQFGPRTRSAISSAREALGLPAGDRIDTALLRSLPDVKALTELQSDRARRYKVSELPERSDPRLVAAIRSLERYEVKFGYFNGHLYLAVLTWGRTWTDAKSMAEKAGGHLVSITSRAENDFVFNLFKNDERFLVSVPDGQRFGPFIGLHQPDRSREPRGGWEWVTGEPVGFEFWSRGQPNNYDGRAHYGIFHTYGSMQPSNDQRAIRWDDHSVSGSPAFIMEVE